LKALASHELAHWNGFFDIFSFIPPSSAQAAGMTISWWNILLSMGNMNPHCFGQMQLALPRIWTWPFSKTPSATKG